MPQNGISSVTIAGSVAFSYPTGAFLPWETATFGSCSLAGNADWSGLGAYPAWLEAGATIDLAGHVLSVVAPSGRAATAATFTSTAATTGEALFLVSDASVKGGDPFAWAVRHLVVSALPNSGAVFEFEPASLGLVAERPFYLLTASELGMTDRLKMTNTGTWVDTGIQDKQCTRIEFAFYQDGGYATESPGWGGGHIGTLDENSFAMSMSNGRTDIWCWWYRSSVREVRSLRRVRR